MKPENRHRLAKLAQSLLNAQTKDRRQLKFQDRTIRFEMRTWATKDGRIISPQQVNECGTSCCFLGYAPQVFPETTQLETWPKVQDWVIGNDPYGHLFRFLFGEKWPSSPKSAVVRALYTLRHNLDSDQCHDLPSTMFSNPELVELMEMDPVLLCHELETYMIPEKTPSLP